MSALEHVASMKAEYEAKVAEFDTLATEIATDLKAAEDKGFDAGIAQAGIPATDKIYTEADLQAELAPLKSQIANLQAQVDGIQASVDAAVASRTAEIVKGIKDAEVDNAALIAKYDVPVVASMKLK